MNGEPLPKGSVVSLTIDARNNAGKPLGFFEYGAQPNPDGSPSPYDTWIFTNQGGAVTVPFAVVDGQLLVGVVEQVRFAEKHATFNPEGKVRNAPRGFHGVLCDPAETSRRETAGEVGVLAGERVRLKGSNANVDTAWFAYEDEQDADGQSVAQGGITAFAVEVAADEMTIDGDGWRVNDTIRTGRPKGSPYEVIDRCVFVEWQEAVKLRDGITTIAVARLLAHLFISGRLTLAIK